MEYPQYTVKQCMKRVLIPVAFKLIILCAIFYIAILFNITLAVKYRMIRTEFNILGYAGVAVFLLLLVALELLLVYKKTKKTAYNFYSNRLEYGAKKKKKTVFYTQIIDPRIMQRSPFDKIFNTGTIKLTDDARLEKIENFNQVFVYLQQLRQAVMKYGYGGG